MNSMERVLTALGHREPDRVPFFLTATMHGAKELGLTIEQYFSAAENVVEGQLAMREKYRHDCLYPFFYAPMEVEAWGGEVLFRESCPPNSGRPFIASPEQIRTIRPPVPEETQCLRKALKAIEVLKATSGDEVPIIGVVVSPFSLPVMQLGFGAYLDLLYEQRSLFWRLMEANETFCANWANAQLRAGATAVAYFDPVSSSTIVPRDVYLETGFEIARRTLARIEGPVAIHSGAGRFLPIIEEVIQSGPGIVGASVLDDLADMKAACRDRVTVLGNLNGIEMARWSEKDAEIATKRAIRAAGAGGGFILSDNHGEIPWQVPDAVLMAIAKAVHEWGEYPLDWIDTDD